MLARETFSFFCNVLFCFVFLKKEVFTHYLGKLKITNHKLSN